MKPSPSIFPLEAHERFAKQIKADKLRLLYEQSFPAVFLSLASALLLSIILWPHTERPVLIGWLTALLIASIARLALFAAYRRASPKGIEVVAWERPYLTTLLMTSAVWGFGGVWIMPDSLLYETVVCYFLMGMAGGAISVYSAIRPFAIAAIAMVLLPATVWMMSKGEATPFVMGAAPFLLFISALRASKVLSASLHQSYLLAHELNASKEAAERLARTDTLTGLNNRRAFSELAQASIRFCQRQGSPVSAIVLDLDHFKQINDRHGHSVGDQALQHIARILQESLRKSDICARNGGEEFAVLLPDTTLDEATQVAEKLRIAIASQPVQTTSGALSVTASMGVASSNADFETLLRLADAAMYQAKQAGRNRVFSHDGPVLATGRHGGQTHRLPQAFDSTG